MGPDQNYGHDPVRVAAGRRIHAHFQIGMERREAGSDAKASMEALYEPTASMSPRHFGPPPGWYEGLVHRTDGTVEFWRAGRREGVATTAAKPQAVAS